MDAVGNDAGSIGAFAAGEAMSVLHVGKYFPPFAAGIEHFMADLLPALAERGVDASALVHNHLPGIRGEIDALPVTASDSGDDGSTHRRVVHLYRVPSLGQLLYAPVSPQFPAWMNRAIRARRPGILHLHMPNTSAFWALFLPAARRLPWMVHWHADVVSSNFDRRLRAAYPFYRPFEQRLLRRASVVVVTSPGYLQDSRALTPWREKCRVVPLGIDQARIPEVSEDARRWADACWGHAGFRVLSVGRLTYYKGHEYLIRAMQEMPATRLVIVGEGQRRRSLEKLIDKLGLNDRILLTGRLSSESMHALMATCDCFCLPSIERTEAFGMVLVEAMAHGKPAVVCNIPGSGVNWVVRDNVTGLAVGPADPEALAQALRAMSSDRRRLKRMGEAAYRRYRDKFRIETVAERIHGLYADVLEAAEGGGRAG